MYKLAEKIQMTIKFPDILYLHSISSSQRIFYIILFDFTYDCFHFKE